MIGNFFVVLVIYKMKISDTPSFQVLQQAVSEGLIRLFIYDNSPEQQELSFLSSEKIHYHHDPLNSGLSKAYDQALDLMTGNESWLLLLDQDTELSLENLRFLSEHQVDNKIAALTPQVFVGERQISPLYADHYIDRNSASVEVGKHSEKIMAINSGTLVNAEFLDTIGGFSNDFPLDFLDHWLFWRIHQAAWKIEVLPLKIKHDLSVLNYSTMSHSRYQSIISAETVFYQKYDTENFSRHKKQLLLRTLKQFMTMKDRFFWKCTLRQYFDLRGAKK